MPENSKPIEVYVESGQTRTFAVALDWPGWCRSGRDEAAALQTLYDYAPRYARVLQAASIDFRVPADATALVVVERQKGNATTDFGAPDLEIKQDAEPVDGAELKRWLELLPACWKAFDAAVAMAAGKTLRKGPRGGGRDLVKIIEHVRDVDSGYLRNLGGKATPGTGEDPANTLIHIRQAILTTLQAAVRGEIPTHGPRGGVRWSPRYFVRRLAWHKLDHAWEIEDRAE